MMCPRTSTLRRFRRRFSSLVSSQVGRVVHSFHPQARCPVKRPQEQIGEGSRDLCSVTGALYTGQSFASRVRTTTSQIQSRNLMMDDDSLKSNWDELAKKLGADVAKAPDPPESLQDQGSDTSPSAPTTGLPQRPPSRRPTPPKPAVADWDSLASNLGLEVPETKAEAPPAGPATPRDQRLRSQRLRDQPPPRGRSLHPDRSLPDFWNPSHFLPIRSGFAARPSRISPSSEDRQRGERLDEAIGHVLSEPDSRPPTQQEPSPAGRSGAWRHPTTRRSPRMLVTRQGPRPAIAPRNHAAAAVAVEEDRGVNRANAHRRPRQKRTQPTRQVSLGMSKVMTWRTR